MPTTTMPTTDVTDVGNKPGDGPLRADGQATASPVEEVNSPSTRSPSSKYQQAVVTMMRDLWGGTESVRAQAQLYLPRTPGEEMPSYRDRLGRSVFFNVTRKTVEGLIGLVFRKDPVLGEDVPVQIAGTEEEGGHWENIDMEGTHGDVFCRQLAEDAQLVGHAAILVDYPKTGGTQRRDEELSLGIRPYWVPIKKEDIISWRSERVQGTRVLTQLVLRETGWVPVGQYGEAQHTVYRVLYQENGVVGYRLLYVSEDRSVTELEAGTYPTQDQIPVAEVRTSGSKGIFESDPPLADLGHLNIAHYQQTSDHWYAIHKTNVPFLFGAGVSEAKGKDKVVIGPNTSIFSQDPQATLQYVSHDGASLGSSKASLDDLKADMGTMGLAMLAPQKRVAETAEAKRLDKSTSDSALSVSARALQDAIEQALYFHARYLRLDDGGSVTINRDFEALLMDAPVMQAYGQLVETGFPSRPVLEALQQGGRIPEGSDLDELQMEWLIGRALDANLPPIIGGTDGA